MKNTSILFIALICCMIAACSEPAATSREETSKPAITMKDMAGTWQSADLRIEITSKDGGPENDTLVVKADEYAEKLQIKSHMAEYREAGTYTESYINRQDSVFQQPAGRWEIKGDSFVVYQEKPKASRRAYHISIEGEDATFTGYVDWDGDGAKDDFFVGKSVKVIDEKDIHQMGFFYAGAQANDLSKEEQKKSGGSFGEYAQNGGRRESGTTYESKTMVWPAALKELAK